MAEYIYFAASLPSVWMDRPSPMTYEEFLLKAKEQLSAKDYKELEKARNGLRIVEQKLSNEKFVSKAPEAVVNAEKEKAAKYSELIAKLEESAKAMQA